MKRKYIVYGLLAFITVIGMNRFAIKRDNGDENIRKISENLVVMTQEDDTQRYLKISKRIRNQQTENFE